MPSIIPRQFYSRPTLKVARDLIGARVVRILNGERLAGLITEAEAYVGEKDMGSHARAGRTPRTTVMFGEPGHAYVYFTYGNHWMLNVVTQPIDVAGAVLIRAIQPVEGIETMLERRSGRDTFGPGKLCQAMGITGAENGIDLAVNNGRLWIEEGQPVPARLVTKGPRVGLYTVPEPWKSKPYRFLVKGWIIENSE